MKILKQRRLHDNTFVFLRVILSVHLWSTLFHLTMKEHKGYHKGNKEYNDWTQRNQQFIFLVLIFSQQRQLARVHFPGVL